MGKERLICIFVVLYRESNVASVPVFLSLHIFSLSLSLLNAFLERERRVGMVLVVLRRAGTGREPPQKLLFFIRHFLAFIFNFILFVYVLVTFIKLKKVLLNRPFKIERSKIL